MIICLQISPKIRFYFYPVMLSEDPMGHTQSTTTRKVLRNHLNDLLGIIYVSCVEHNAEHTPRA